MPEFIKFPRQKLMFSQKTKKWRKQILDWASSKTFFNFSLVQKSIIHKKINYDLLNGVLHMNDLMAFINPDDIQASYIPEKIQHYPIMNSKINLLRGEESKRIFDYRVVVTNPSSISDIEEAKKEALYQTIMAEIQNTSQSEEDFNKRLEEIEYYFKYKWQDFREQRANAFINHYEKELNFKLLFNNGFIDAITVGEEIYACDIVGGEPVIERVNPLKIRAFKSGYSNRIEDADIIIIEDYWSPGRIIDTYYDVLSDKDINYLENLPDHVGQSYIDNMDNIDERYGFINGSMVDESLSGDGFFSSADNLFSNTVINSIIPYDIAGNVRVLRVFWKSKRCIKKIKSFDPETGEEIFDFYPENYNANPALGEEEQKLWINQAWEGVKIGSDIYVNMRPRIVQYNRLSNPSRCHFGIVGSVYNLNESKPFSLVDMMKMYNYEYDAIHDRLNKMISRNWGKMVQLDFAKVPKGWDIEKWLYYAKINGLYISDSFKEGNTGAATGKLAGALNNASSGVIDADWGNNIQQYINLLEFIKMEMSEVVGVTKQREGQISNRETVGGVERATLQSSHITEWLFLMHDDVKKRAIECFIETAKAAYRGRKIKFKYVLPDYSEMMVEIDGDEFAESDYGLVVDNSEGTQKLNSQLETLAQAGLQNHLLTFSTLMKIYNTSSIAEKQKLIENDERKMLQMQQEQSAQQNQLEQAKLEQEMQLEQAKLQNEREMNTENNEVKLLIANIDKKFNEENNTDGIIEPMSEADKEKLKESIRQFNAKLNLDKDKLELEKQKHKDDVALKEKQIRKQSANKVK